MSSYHPAPTISAQRSSPTEQQWDSYKELIRQLYIIQDMRLKDLVATMRKDHDFCATARMYKSRFSKWQFAKNNNFKDMQTVAHQIAQERPTDTSRRFEVNGRSVTAQEVSRYFKRRAIKRLEDVVERTTTIAPIPPAEESSGAVPSARSRAIDVPFPQNLEGQQVLLTERQGLKNSSITDVRSDGLLPALGTPATLIIPSELVLNMVAVYYTGCCETNLWYTCTAGRFRTRRPVFDAATVLDRFVGFWSCGLEFARNGSMLDCYRTLSQACRKLPRIIQAEHPSTVRALLEMLLEYGKAGFCTLAVLVLKEVVRIGPPHHPLAIICRKILRVSASEAESLALSTLACGADTIAKQCGEHHYCVIRCRVALVKANSAYLDGAQIVEQTNQILTHFAQSDQFSAEGYLSICDSLLENLCELGALGEAETMIERMKQCARDLCPERTRRWMVNCMDLLSQVQFSQRRYELAEQNCRDCIQARIADFGISDSRALACMLRLSCWLRLWNRCEEALEVEAWRATGLE